MGSFFSSLLSSLLFICSCVDAIHDTMWRLSQDASKVVAGVVLHFITQLCESTGLHMYSQSVDKDASADDAGVSPWAGAWPTGGQLMVLQLIPALFPGSDKRHVVVTPTLMLIEGLLARCPLRASNDLARGVLLANIALRYVGESKRVAGSVPAFVSALILHAIGSLAPISTAAAAVDATTAMTRSAPKRQWTHSFEDGSQEGRLHRRGGKGGSASEGEKSSNTTSTVLHLKVLQACVDACPSFSTLPLQRIRPGWMFLGKSSSNLHILPSMLSAPTASSECGGGVVDTALALAAAPILSAALTALMRLCALYGELPSFPELVAAPCLLSSMESIAANEVAMGKLAPALRRLFVRATAKLTEQVAAASALRRAIGVQKHAGLSSLKILDPLFSDKFAPGSMKSAGSLAEQTRAEHRALKKTLKQGRKNAARELRRDSEFIGRERDKDVRAVPGRSAPVYTILTHTRTLISSLLSPYFFSLSPAGREEERRAESQAQGEPHIHGGGCGDAQRDGSEADCAWRRNGRNGGRQEAELALKRSCGDFVVVITVCSFVFASYLALPFRLA